jgi:biopolymer transport protein ExbB
MNILYILQGSSAAGSEGGGDAPEGIEEVTRDIPIWELVQQGGWYIMIPLGILSLLTVYIFVERYLQVRKAQIGEQDFMNRIKDYLHDGKIDAARDLCSQTDNPAARMIEKGISRIGKPVKDIAAGIENVGKLEVYKLERKLSFLATASGAAPMLGFLGTTIGMVQVFHQMKFQTSIELQVIAPGIMQAMVTTVAGLIVGIMAYVAYNYLVARVEKVIYQMENASIEFLDLLHEPGK